TPTFAMGGDWSMSCPYEHVILIVTPNLRADESTDALRRATNQEIVLAESLVEAATLLRADSYLAVVLDQYLLETEPAQADAMMRNMGTAIPLQVNLALSGVDRLVRELRAAVNRRRREEAAARNAAVNTLRSELNGTVTALLLSFELAMGAPDMPSSAVA